MDTRPTTTRTPPRRFARTLVALLIAASSGIAAAEQQGLVTVTGVPVPGATITATKGEKKVATATDTNGRYSIADIEDGTWTIKVEMPGFAALTREVTVAPAAEPQTFELTLLPFAEITRGIEVPAPAPSPPPAATAQSPARPAQNRPAATTTPAPFQRAAVTAANPRPANAPPPEEPPADPVFGAADGFLVNGSVNNGAASPFAQSAAFGNNRRVVGSRYNYSFGLSARNSSWDASPSTFGGRLPSQPDYNNLNVNGTVGGPIRIPGLWRNGPQFTLTYQRSTDQSATTSSALMPDAQLRSGDFSGSGIAIVDPLTGQPFAGNTIPTDRISPQAAALLAYYPLPNVEGSAQANYQRALPNTTVRDAASVNIGPYSFNPRNQLQGAFQYQRSDTDSTSLFGFDDRSRASGFDGSTTYTRRFSPLFLVRSRNSFGRQSSTTTPFFANRINVSGDAGILGNDQDPVNWGPPAIGLSTFAGLSSSGYAFSRTDTITSTAEAFYTRGRHALSFGGDLRHHALNLISQQNPRGNFFFAGRATGSDFADFLLGLPTTSRIAYGNADKYFRAFSYAAFITDDFRVGPSFTMNVGVRWEYEAPYTETQGRLVNLDVAPGFTAVSPVLASDPTGALTGRAFSTSLVRPDKMGIQPRTAIAWRPILGSSVLVRAGYGIYRNNGSYQSLARALAQQPPLSYAVNAENSLATPLTLANGFIASPSITPNSYAIDPDFKVSYAHVWQASLQRDLPFSLTFVGTYLGTRGVNLVQQFLPNTYAPGSANPCPTCPIGFAYVTSTGSSLRNSAQFQVRRRLRNGLQASLQYTLAKATDNASTFSGTSGTSAQNWLDLDAEHGPSFDDQRHQLGTQVQYTTGVGLAGGGMLDGIRGTLLKNWVLTGRFVIGSGRPLTPLYSTSLPGTAVNGTVRAALTGVDVDAIPDGYFLNPLAYGIPAAGAWGSAGRNSVRGPQQFSLDAGLTRAFTLTQRVNLEWRVDATNLLNRVTYNTINTIVNSPQFGLPTGTNDMRKITTNVRVRF